MKRWAIRLKDVIEKMQNKKVKFILRYWCNQFKSVLSQYKDNRQRIDRALTHLEDDWERLKEHFTTTTPSSFGNQIPYLEKDMKKQGICIENDSVQKIKRIVMIENPDGTFKRKIVEE